MSEVPDPAADAPADPRQPDADRGGQPARLGDLGVALVTTDEDRRIVSWEGAAERIFGFTAEEAIGRRADELPISTPEASLRVRDLVYTAPELPLEHDMQLLRRDGTGFPARVRLALRYDASGAISGTAVMVVDTSLAARADDEPGPGTSLGPVAALGTLASEGGDRADLVDRLVALVAETMSIDLVGVVVVSADRRSLGFEAGIGWDGEAFTGEPVPLSSPDAVFLLPTGRPVVVSGQADGTIPPGGLLARHGASDGIAVPLGNFDRPSGALVAFSTTPRVFGAHETEFLQAVAYVLTASTERERSREIERRFHRLSRMEAMGQLTGGIAHDFNNLLGVILNYASFAREESRSDDDPGESIDEIETAARRAAELTHQLLVFSRQEVVTVEPIDVSEAVDAAEALLARTLGHGIRLEHDLEPDLKPIEAGRGQIEQIVINLAVNARDAMPDGGTLLVRVGAAGTPAAGDDYGWIRVEVADDGIGMRREVLEKAFEPFFTTKPLGQGSGLGLATVYGIVSALGGSVELRSEPGEGTVVDILLPVLDGDRSGPEDGDSDGAGAGEQAEALPRRVLLVEDDEMVRRLTTRVLQTGGYEAVVAPSAPAALELVDRDDTAGFGVLLTDVVMPDMSGVDLAQALRERVPGLRVVFMSGYTGDSVSREDVREIEAGFVEKPFTPESLLESLEAAFEQLRS